jgi:hypothetical protein
LGYVNDVPIVIDDVWLFPMAPAEVVLSWHRIRRNKTFITSSSQYVVGQRIALSSDYAGLAKKVYFEQSNKMGWII